MNEAVHEVLSRFGINRADTLALGNRSGFSGARLWRCQSERGELCLRAWPEPTSPEKLAVIHHWMTAARLDFVPAVLRTRTAGTFVLHEGHLWDLTSWMPGKADFHEHPTRERLEQACRALAALHRAWEPLHSRQGTCPAVERRLQAWQEWHKLVSAGWRPPVDRAWSVVARFAPQVPGWLVPWTLSTQPLQPCLCDVWHDHLLFEGDRLTGIVDYGEAKIDHVAVDLARMLGGLIADEDECWQIGLSAYRRVRSLSDSEAALARLLDRTGTILGAANWLRWLHHEGRQFEDVSAAQRRLGVLVARMEQW